MKKRDVILDFTSLLDVTLIVIFFFVLFSHLDSETNKTKTESVVAEYETKIAVAEKREAEAAELQLQLEEDIKHVAEANERLAENIHEMLEFSNSGNLKLILVMQDDGWLLRVNKNTNTIAEITSTSDVESTLKAAIKTAGYDTESTLFCDFVFHGSKPGSAKAYRTITKSINEIQKEFKYLYYSETDLSIGEG